MVPRYAELRHELKAHLIDSGMTYSPEAEALGTPVTMREVKVDVMLDNMLDYMIGRGYVQAN